MEPRKRDAQVLRIKDGDTAELLLDQGFGDSKRISLRLAKTRAPEVGQLGHDETAQYLSDWALKVLARNPAQWPFKVEIQRTASGNEIQSFTRYVGDLLDLEGNSAGDAVNAFVLANGYPLGRALTIHNDPPRGG